MYDLWLVLSFTNLYRRLMCWNSCRGQDVGQGQLGPAQDVPRRGARQARGRATFHLLVLPSGRARRRARAAH